MSELLCTKPATVMMPRALTAENGAKAAMIGEFSIPVTVGCPSCAGIGRSCPVCNGSGAVRRSVDVPWTTIKEIYAKAVETLGT